MNESGPVLSGPDIRLVACVLAGAPDDPILCGMRACWRSRHPILWASLHGYTLREMIWHRSMISQAERRAVHYILIYFFFFLQR